MLIWAKFNLICTASICTLWLPTWRISTEKSRGYCGKVQWNAMKNDDCGFSALCTLVYLIIVHVYFHVPEWFFDFILGTARLFIRYTRVRIFENVIWCTFWKPLRHTLFGWKNEIPPISEFCLVSITVKDWQCQVKQVIEAVSKVFYHHQLRYFSGLKEAKYMCDKCMSSYGARSEVEECKRSHQFKKLELWKLDTQTNQKQPKVPMTSLN